MSSLVLIGVLAGLLALAPAALARRASPARIGYAKLVRACRAASDAQASCFAIVRRPVPAADATQPGVSAYTVDDGASSGGPTGGLTPNELASAYGYQPSGGQGQTVAIVDAYDDPEIEANLASFDSHYGLAACTSPNGCFEKVGQTGSPTSLPAADKTGWSVEISLDVETVHSVCKGCKIVLVEADSDSFLNLAIAVDEAVALGATEVSNSYGGPEGELVKFEEEAYDHPGVVISAATGDEGYYDWAGLNEGFATPERPNTPATLPTVVAVGGTTLELNENGTRAAETVWNGNGPGDDSEFAEGATGGGCSLLYEAPPWQSFTAGYGASGCAGKRLAADVAAVADPDTGFDIFDTYDCGIECERFGVVHGASGWLTIGGTSLATPLISAAYGLAGGAGGVPYPALTLYSHLGSGSLFDVTSGGNGYCDAEALSSCKLPKKPAGIDCKETTACDAGPGYDGPTGVGTPNGLGAFAPELPQAALAPSNPTPAAGETVGFSSAGSSDPYPGSELQTYTWSWGDGSAAGSGPSPSHTFAAKGTYTVKLTVTDTYGVSASATTSVTVHEGTLEEEARKAKEEEKEQAEKGKTTPVAPQPPSPPGAPSSPAPSTLTAPLQEVAGFKTSAAKAPSPDAVLARRPLVASPAGVITVKISCPAGESSCAGVVTLRTVAEIASGASRSSRSHGRIVTLGSASFDVAGGDVGVAEVHLSSRVRALLAGLHQLQVRVSIVAHDPAGASHSSTSLTTLRLQRSRARPR